MKALKYFAAIICLLLGMLPHQANATTISQLNETIYLENGCSIAIELVVVENRATSTKTGKKSYIYKNNNGTEQWRATLSGTFTYTGTAATCNSSSCAISVSDSAWYEISKSASRSGSSAIAEVTMGEKFLGITINKENLSMKLTCSPTGSLS